MIPPRDRVGQIASYSRWLEHRLGATVRGCWVPERVWEQSFTTDLVAAGIQYTMLDDSHFKNAGLSEDELHGYYLTEDNGHLLAVFPDSEPLRYMIPFAPPQDTIDYLGRIHQQFPGAVAVFGDDGEKFGAWPQTKQSVYGERLAGAVFRPAGATSILDSHLHAGGSLRCFAAARKGLHSRRQLSRDDRVGACRSSN